VRCFKYSFSRLKLNIDVEIYILFPSWSRLLDPLKRFLKPYFAYRIRGQT